MRKPTPLEQAKELQDRVKGTLFRFREGVYVPSEFSESEVKFRYAAIEGMLIMVQNDVDGLVRAWEEMT